MTHATGEEIRRVRQALGEDQTVFGTRFGVHRRTIIRWEKGGHSFSEWGSWERPDRKTEADLWKAVVTLAESSAAKAEKKLKRKSTTALGARKPKAARRRQSASKAVAVKRRRGSVARRRSVSRAKNRRAKK
ncbi:MAG TPA: hypothetical protein VJ437_13085 [Acidiferrobacterales bacterium]|nr:hypothetical protein [Acidiferrobacterales bacterium]